MPRDYGTPESRFWAKVDKTESCWYWTAAKVANGYGTFSKGGRSQLAHRVSYEWACGPIPEGMHLDHLCANRDCVNPEHLEAVTQQENNRRKGQRWREMRGQLEAASKQTSSPISEMLDFQRSVLQKLDLLTREISSLRKQMEDQDSQWRQRLAEIETRLSTSTPGSQKLNVSQVTTRALETFETPPYLSW